jgi:hypothetical protein
VGVKRDSKVPIKKKDFNFKPRKTSKPAKKGGLGGGKFGSSPKRNNRELKEYFRKGFYISCATAAVAVLGIGISLHSYFNYEPKKDELDIITRDEWNANEERLFIPTQDDPETEVDDITLTTERFNLNDPIYNQYPEDLHYHKVEDQINGRQLRYAKYYSKPTRIVVHHTATTSPLGTTAEVQDYLQRLLLYHTNPDSPGVYYGDISYHYLVDKKGNIYEGRKGGPEVVGAHVEGANTGSIGIAVIGDYQGSEERAADQLSQESLDSLQSLIFNLSVDYDIDPDGVVEFLGQEIEAVAGHQSYLQYSSNPNIDPESYTECPGVVLQEKIDDVKAYALEFEADQRNILYVTGFFFVLFILATGTAMFLKERL